MERRPQVDSAIGRENVEFLLHEIEEGGIKDHQVKGIALAMEHGVHGVYKQRNMKRIGISMSLCYTC